uniref:TMV resistance protein N-like n=1 Tax=Fragaria vesca subsp. vesca TaxID=101020 RepID=UPI0005CA9D19|nr:PREDICTED: TMV resistance protein N-like [Fragaria vesca subsp. vesca]
MELIEFCKLELDLIPRKEEARRESTFIENIIEEISVQVLNRTYLNVAKYLVGIESRTQDIYQLLGVEVDDVCTVGICGIAGIGKTTLAKAVYNSIVHKFEVGYFLECVQDNSTTHGGPIQPQKIFEILEGKQMEVANIDEQISMIRDMLRDKRVLLIIDDVKQMDELSILIGGSESFGLGSRIIITTRDKNLLTSHQVNYLMHEVKELDFGEVLELFSWNAFQSKLPHDYAKLAPTIVHYAQGIPLGLIVLGSLLRGKTIDEWKTIFDGYQRASSLRIQEILKISYNALEDSVKEVFLHIACFLNGKDKNYVKKMLDSFHHNPEYGIEVLKEKSLISIDENHIQMIDLLEEMGKEIVQQESLLKLERPRRVWFNDFNHILLENTDRNRLNLLKKDIVIKMPRPNDLYLTAKSFSKATSADWTYLLVGLILEISSVFFDQESSPSKPLNAFFGMLLAIASLLTCICELIHKGIKERVVLRRCGTLWWFRYPNSRYVLFGNLRDCFGLLGSIFQCICSTIQYVYYIRCGTNPIKVSLLPAIFLICVALLNSSTRKDEIIEQND